MIQITIDWDFISPGLQTVSGVVKVFYVSDTVTIPWKELAKFRTTVKPGSVGYKSLDDKGVSSNLLDAIKPQLDVMVRSYQQGVIMDKKDFTWIMPDEIDKAREKLKKLPCMNNEEVYEEVYFEICEDQSKV